MGQPRLGLGQMACAGTVVTAGGTCLHLPGSLQPLAPDKLWGSSGADEAGAAHVLPVMLFPVVLIRLRWRR